MSHGHEHSSGDATPLEQYAEILRALIEAVRQVQTHDYSSSMLWLTRCVSTCFDPESNEFDSSRAFDTVTSLAWMFTRLLDFTDDATSALWRFVAEVQLVDLPELESQRALPPIRWDLVSMLSELDIDLGKMSASATEGTLMAFIKYEIGIAKALNELDEPGFVERFATQDNADDAGSEP